MASFLNVCRFLPTLGGTTNWTYASAVTGYQSPTLAGVVSGALYRYRAESADLSQWEIGYGTYSVGVFARTVVMCNSSGTGIGIGQSGAGSKINFSTVPQVAIVALAEDLLNSIQPQGRMTLTSGTPVMSTSVAGATTLYYTQFAGEVVPIYDGANMVPTVFSELSLVTTDTTKSPAAVAANKQYDVFIWIDPATGVLTFSRGPAWTNATTRGYTLTSVNGILVNTSAITNGPAALRGTYVGTIWSNLSSTIDFIFGTSGSGGVPAFLLVWNAYNRVNVGAKVWDNAAFTYTSATIAGYHSGTMFVAFVMGAQTDAISWSFAVECVLVNSAGNFGILGVGYDTQAAFNDQRFIITYPVIQQTVSGAGVWNDCPIGAHLLSLNQRSDGVNANQFNNAGTARLNCELWM